MASGLGRQNAVSNCDISDIIDLSPEPSKPVFTAKRRKHRGLPRNEVNVDRISG